MVSAQRIEDQLLECQEKPKWGKNKGQALHEAKDNNEDVRRIPCGIYKGLRKQVVLVSKDLVAQEHIISPSFVENYLVGLHFLNHII